MRFVGIDYSMTSPAACFCRGPEISWEDCEVHYLTSSPRHVGVNGNCVGTAIPEWTTQEERFDFISDHFASLMKEDDFVLLEGYAMGASGRVFHIGENTGLLKHKMWLLGCEFVVAPPSSIKKHATGKGNSDKAAMNDAFLERTGFDIKAALGLTAKQWSPSGDVVDSFFACSLAAASGDNFTRS